MDVDSPVEEDAAEEETGKKAKNGGGKMKSKKKVESSGSDDDEPIVPASKKRKENAPSPDEKKDRPQYRLRDFEVDDMSVVYGEDGLDEFDGHYGLVEDVVAGAEKAAVRAGHEEEFNPELKRLREEHENMRAGLVENEEVRKALQEKAERRLPQRDADKKEDDDEDHGHEDLNQAYTYIFVGDVSKQVYKYDQVNRYWRIRTDQAPLTIHDTEGENTRVIHGMTREEYLEDLYQKREDRRQQAAFEKRQAQRERQERQREKRDSTMLTGAERAERKARKKREREQRPGAQQFLESESELEEDAEMQLEEGRAELEAVNPDPALRELRKLAEVSRKIAESDQGDPDIIAFTDKYGFGYRMWRWKLIHPTTSAKTEEAQRKPPKKIELSKEDAVTKEAREKLGFHYRPKGDDKHVPDKYLIEFRRIDEETGYWRPEDGEEEDWKIVYREKVDETTEEVRQGTAARKVSDSLAQADEKLVTRLRLEAADAAGSGNRQDRQLVQRKQHKLFFKQWKDLIAGKTRPNHEHSERPEAYWFFLRHGSMSRRDLYAPPHNFETGFQGRSGIRFVAHDRFREQQNKVFLGRLLQQRTLPISNSMKPLAYKNEQADAATAAKQKGSAKVPAEATYAGVEADQYDAGADANLLDGGDRSAVPYAMGPDYDQGELYDENAPWDAHEADAFGNISAAPNQDDYNYGAY
ncbi:unnamed protein product [Amoebophrya sp. A25]|nr:unnamed protein product [Amoebophrya sp. A25]|eukprot:GSA25T00000035001.1